MFTHTQTRMLFSGFLVTLITHVCAADVQEFFDFEQWENAAGEFTFIGFTEYPQGTILTDQYADLGINFTDNNPTVLESDYFFEDGHGIWFDQPSGFDNIWVEFEEPITAIGTDLVGPLQIELFANGEPLNEPDPFGGEFLGYVSDEPFDSAILLNPGGSTTIDNLYFGPPIPAPGALGLFAFGSIVLKPRRRRK